MKSAKPLSRSPRLGGFWHVKTPLAGSQEERYATLNKLDSRMMIYVRAGTLEAQVEIEQEGYNGAVAQSALMQCTSAVLDLIDHYEAKGLYPTIEPEDGVKEEEDADSEAGQ